MAPRLIIRDRQQTTLLMCVFVVAAPVSTQSEVHFDIHFVWTCTSLSFETFAVYTHTHISPRRVGRVCERTNPEKLHHIPFQVHGVIRMLSIHILCHYVTHLSWQVPWLHIIWVISLYFYGADVSPCQQAPDKARWRTLLFESVGNESPLSPFLPSAHTILRDPAGHGTESNPDGGKTYFNRCPCLCSARMWK